MDRQVLDWIVAHRTAWMDHLALDLKVVGQSALSFFAVIAATAAITVRRRQWVWGLGMVFAGAGAVVVSAVAKQVVRRPRPPLADALVRARGWSMPSSVALLCAALAVAVVAGWDREGERTPREAVAVVTAVCLLFGWAVVYLAAHWVSDVLVGWAIGAVVGAVAVLAARRVVGSWIDARNRVGRSDAVGDAEQAGPADRTHAP